jgi:tetratricopeptide (TPR) repeat protein
VTDPRTLRAQADRILELHETGELEEALEACEDLLAQVGDDALDDVVVRESVFTARFQRAVLLTELGDLAAAVDAYATAAATPTDLDDPDQRHELAMALLNQGICHEALDEVDAALGVYDRLVARLGDADDPVTADQVVRGRVNRASALLALDRVDDALAAAEALVSELDPHDAYHVEQLAMAVRLRAVALVELGREEEAVDALGGLEGASRQEATARRQLASAAGERAELLRRLGREEEALEALEVTTRSFASDDDEEVAELVTDLLRVEIDLLESLGDRRRADEVRLRASG